MVIHWLPLALFAVFFVIAVAVRSFLHWRATGINPYVLASDDSPEGYVARALRWAVAGLLAALAGEGFGWTAWMGTLPWDGNPVAFRIGVALALAALLWIVVAQAQMGASWRIGIDRQRATALVRGGLFAHSRNPIYLGTRVALLGAVLLVPNAVTL